MIRLNFITEEIIEFILCEFLFAVNRLETLSDVSHFYNFALTQEGSLVHSDSVI